MVNVEVGLERKKTKSMVLIGLMTAVMCVVAPISLTIPVSPVPISLTGLAVYFTVYVLGMKQGTICYFIYLLTGLVGLPVFSGFTGGVGKIFGPTGGYLIGFIFASLICGFFIGKYPGKVWIHFVGMVLGMIVSYSFGTLWLSLQANMDFTAALWAGVIPFIPGDLVKISIALGAGNTLKKQLKRAGSL